jgi:hypothetical protein
MTKMDEWRIPVPGRPFEEVGEAESDAGWDANLMNAIIDLSKGQH